MSMFWDLRLNIAETINIYERALIGLAYSYRKYIILYTAYTKQA